MNTYVARVTIVEIPDDPLLLQHELTDMTVHDTDPEKLSDRVAEILSYTLKTGDPKL